MIFAAGLGTRMLPLTDSTPKALVDVGGVTLLERTIARLVTAGCDRIIVNVHHHAERIVEFLRTMCPGDGNETGDMEAPWSWSGAHIFLSPELDGPLETGGGLKKARGLFRGEGTILVHNVDVISSIDLADLVRVHETSEALATLAVNRRPTGRHLVFDGSGLCGRLDSRSGVEEWAKAPAEPNWQAGFTGIHALSSDILSQLSERGAFSIMRSYLRLSAAGARILPHDVTGARWMDVGTPERLEAARSAWAGPV